MQEPDLSNPPPNPASSPDGNAPAATPPPPRAFAQGTGVLLQIVGVILFLTTCCVCSSSGLWEDVMTAQQAERKVHEKEDIVITFRKMLDEPGRAGASIMVVFSTVCGLALAGFGLGLQADKPRASIGALVSACAWLFSLILAGVCLWIGQASSFARGVNAGFCVISIIVLCFTVAARREVRANPPPPGLDVLPPDFEIPKYGRH